MALEEEFRQGVMALDPRVRRNFAYRGAGRIVTNHTSGWDLSQSIRDEIHFDTVRVADI